MATAASTLRRQFAQPAVQSPGTGIPAGMGGGQMAVSASLNAGLSGDTDGTGTGALLILTGGVVALVLFYLWTHSIQGGP